MSRLNLRALEGITVNELDKKKRSLKRIRHWQRQLWKAAEKGTGL